MDLSILNPHIRYCAVLSNSFRKNIDSICYDCRLFFIIDGTGIVIANQRQYHISNNSILYLPPGTQYRFYMDKNLLNLKIIVLDFDLIHQFSHLQSSLKTATPNNFDPDRVVRYDMPSEFAQPFVKTTPSLYNILMKCVEEFAMQNYLYREVSSALLKLCLLEAIRQYTSNSQQSKVAPVLDYIHSNYHDTDLTNESIASIFNYHPYYLSHLVKECTGVTLHQYIIQYRIKIAKKKLITTDDSISNIAWKSGFHSTAYFIKIFKSQVGITPQTYRKEHIPFLF